MSPIACLEALPPPVKAQLDAWLARVVSTLGDELVGVLVHGSVVRGEYQPGSSDVDVVVVLRNAARAQLEALGNAMQLARAAARIEAMIVTEAELAGACDAFPLLYDDIQQRHVVLHGRDPFASLTVHDTHRRLRIEQELREARIRLRRAVTDTVGTRDALAGALVRKTRQLRATLHALLKLKGVDCEATVPAVFTKAGEVWGLDLAPLRAPRSDVAAAHDALVALLDRTIAEVDALETRPAGGTR